jgi:crotonobetainyl-CoA:carnitine CoA-transferase CaiB-like acyl-CoA transferase
LEDQWLSDPRFADDIKRGDNGPVISERMARWCAERTTQQAVDTLGGAMIPAGPVLSPQQALDHPHIRATGFMQDVDYPGLPIPAPVERRNHFSRYRRKFGDVQSRQAGRRVRTAERHSRNQNI